MTPSATWEKKKAYEWIKKVILFSFQTTVMSVSVLNM